MMNKVMLLSAALVVSLVHGADNPLLTGLSHVRFPEEHRVVSGAIGIDDLDRVRKAGIQHIVNLRAPEEHPNFDEGREVTQRGIEYHSIPISGPKSLTEQNVVQFDRVLEGIGEESALIHCSSGNRVGALIALREVWINGRAPDDAIAEGKRWGLAALEPTVRGLIGDESVDDSR